MTAYNYRLLKDLLIVDLNGQHYLLDSGTPFSIGHNPLVIAGRSYPVHEDYLGVSTAFLSHQLGIPIAGTIGADVFRDFTLEVEPLQRRLSLGLAPTQGCILIPMRQFIGSPLVRVAMGGKIVTAVIDSGANFSCVLPDLDTAEAVSTSQLAFHPLLGNFTTRQGLMQTTIGGLNLQLRFCSAPAIVRELLIAAQAQVLIGSELFQHFDLSLSVREAILRIIPTTPAESLRNIA